jgi:hypothetical protein
MAEILGDVAGSKDMIDVFQNVMVDYWRKLCPEFIRNLIPTWGFV